MPKIKTRKSALKRFRKTPTGKFIRRKAFKGHLLEKKTSKRKKNLSRKMVVFKGDAIALRSMIPYA
jgi:large subunit ribosomal protein L35